MAVEYSGSLGDFRPGVSRDVCVDSDSALQRMQFPKLYEIPLVYQGRKFVHEHWKQIFLVYMFHRKLAYSLF